MMAQARYASDSSHNWTFSASPSSARSEPEPPDFCSREGAQALRDKIEAYWRARGLDVMLTMHNVGFHPAIRAARYDVRSDMINGMPRTAGAAAAEPKPTAIETVEADEVEDLDDLWLD